MNTQNTQQIDTEENQADTQETQGYQFNLGYEVKRWLMLTFAVFKLMLCLSLLSYLAGYPELASFFLNAGALIGEKFMQTISFVFGIPNYILSLFQ